MKTAVVEKRKKTRLQKTWLWITGIIISLLITGTAGGLLYTGRSLPAVSGEIAVAGLEKEVEVIRDRQGVPHIKAESLKDLYFAQGYVQAQDRLFQMDLSRRQASGMLSEAVGSAALDRDKYFRTLGLRRAAKASLSEYSNEGRNVLQWFADGVNAYREEAAAKGRLPVEFTLLGYEPEPWTPLDSLTIGKYMAFDLGGHWNGQAFRYWAVQHLPDEKSLELFPSYPKEAPYIVADIKGTDADIGGSFAQALIPPEDNGSNNWAVSGEKSESGKPLLADDPHLSLATPSIWYQMHLQAENIDVSGVIFAGVPGIILGHNRDIAWGVTNTGPDVQDLYIEKRNPEKPNEFEYNGRWEKADIINEPIKVKGGKTEDYKVTVTRHGPVISEFAYQNGDGHVLALQWTALQPSSELEAVLNMNRAANWNEFEKALLHFETPAQNFVFASKDGTIAYKANGKIPIRKKGNGLLPVPGWTDEYGWEDYIPFDELPRIVNPPEGFISTANNKVISDEYPYHISHHWAQPYRQMRIREFLKEKDRLSLEDFKKLQMDKKNLYGQEFVPIFLKGLEGASLSKVEKQALSQLETWDYEDAPNLAAPLIFHLWMKEIQTALYKDDIPEDISKLFEGRAQVTDELIRKAAAGEEGAWIREAGGLQTLLRTSLNHTVKRLEADYGRKPEKWKWGEYHRLYFAHPMSGTSPILAFFFNREKSVPIGGSNVTVQAASYNQEGIVNHGASWRFVIDTADLTKGYHIVGPGQSGHFRSPWYHSQIGDWSDGTYHVTSLKAKAEKGRKLLLKPAF